MRILTCIEIYSRVRFIKFFHPYYTECIVSMFDPQTAQLGILIRKISTCYIVLRDLFKDTLMKGYEEKKAQQPKGFKPTTL